MLSPHTALGLVASRKESPVCGGARLSSSSFADQARRFEADHSRQVPHRCLELLFGLRNRTAATNTPALFAAASLRSLRLPADPLECLPKESFAYEVPGRAWRFLAVLKTMTGEYAPRGTGTQEFGASRKAPDGAFLSASASLQTILHRTISAATVVARAERYCS